MLFPFEPPMPFFLKIFLKKTTTFQKQTNQTPINFAVIQHFDGLRELKSVNDFISFICDSYYFAFRKGHDIQVFCVHLMCTTCNSNTIIKT